MDPAEPEHEWTQDHPIENRIDERERQGHEYRRDDGWAMRNHRDFDLGIEQWRQNDHFEQCDKKGPDDPSSWKISIHSIAMTAIRCNDNSNAPGG